MDLADAVVTPGATGARQTPPAPRAVARPRATTRPARQSSLREHNLGLVLREIVDCPTPPTRARIAEAVGLTKATVTELVDLLVAARLVVELAPQSGERAGRPGVPLAPAPRAVVGLGLEAQVDHVAVRVVDLAGVTLFERLVEGDFGNSDPGATLRRLLRVVEPVARQAKGQGCVIAGACISVPGLTRRGSGVVRYAPNLGWEEVDVAALLSKSPVLQGISVYVGNDADLGALAEARIRSRLAGVPRTDQSFLFLTGEVGIGGAIVLGGELVSGMHGWSGEIGHLVVEPQGPQCGCGSRGCLEVYAGKRALLRRAGLPATAGVDALGEAVERGDSAANAAIIEASDALGLAVSNAINLIDVDRIVVGGAYAPLFELLAPGMHRHLATRVISRRWMPVEVEAAVSGELASLTGAALRVIDDIVDHPASWVATASGG